MNETKRWAIALLMTAILAVGGNYWMTTISQAEMGIKIENLTARIDTVDKRSADNSDLITENIITLNKVSHGWETVAKAVDANTIVLDRFTEVMIRLEERDNLKNDK